MKEKQMSQTLPKKINTQSLNQPILLVEQEDGTHFVHLHNHNHTYREATGIDLKLHRASELKTLLNNQLPVSPNDSLDVKGLRQIDTYFDTLGIPLRTTDGGWHDKGWISVEIQFPTSKQWRDLEPYTGRYAILIWNTGM
jgi:hypothetical protein